MNDEPVLRLEEVTRRFGSGDTALDILRGVELSLRPGELVALVGPSGAGQSTLLPIAGLLANPTSRRVLLGGPARASHGHRLAARPCVKACANTWRTRGTSV